MNLNVLKELENNVVTQEIYKQGNRVGNLFCMEEALLLTSAFQKDRKTRIVVKKNRYEAQQLYQRVSQLEEDVLLFVMEESLRVQAIASSPEDTQAQIHFLSQVIEEQPRLIICNTAAFLRYLPNKEFFKSMCFSIQVGQEMDMKDLKSRLNRAGYAKVNYVDRPCTYASRGGIVDIFSLGQEHPVRIEFFDTEIDSIRIFDEQTQRTMQAMDCITIQPATDLLFTNEQIESIQKSVYAQLEEEKSKLDQEAWDVLQDHVEADMNRLSTYDTSTHLYWYFSYISSHQLLDYVDGQVIFSSQEEIERYTKKLNEDTIAFMQEMVIDHKMVPRYMMFHDLYEIERNYSILMFHEFLDYKNPITSNIYPVEVIREPLDEFLLSLKENEYIAMDAQMANTYKIPEEKRMDPIFYEGFSCEFCTIYTEKELFQKPVKHQRYQKSFKEGQILENVLELEKNDYIVHANYGIGQYLGIVTRNQNGKNIDYLHIVYRGGDELFVPLSQFQLVRKYISKEGVGVRLSQLGSNQWKKTKERVNAKVEEIAERLVQLYAHRNENIGFAYAQDDALQKEFDDAFAYEPTPDQLEATAQIKAEMEKPKPMDHLLCGDVGFGKTEVAMRCAFKAISNGKQVMFLCPTTILSMQHFKSLQARFAYTGANIEMVNRFVPESKIKDIEKKIQEGLVDIVVGTHKLLNKRFVFKDLGLLIIDEEQRFGVEHKERMKEFKNNIDVLALSATPIPRTLQMSLIGVRTISQLNTPPAHRHPIQTYVLEKRGSAIQEVIQRELARDGQVFYLYNRVADIYAVAQDLKRKFPDVEIAVAHGKMDREQIEETMVDFAAGKYKILVCTTIIETGLDIANANTMIIEDADHFGLSQLYQIRGRVGRREKIAYCYLMVQPRKELTEEAQKRLKSIKEFTQLGSGYKIAMRDLTIRGAGDMLGPQQAGFIDQVGLDMYLELLSNAIARKQGKEIEEVVEEKVAHVSTNGYIPAGFTENDGDKLDLYQEIRKMHTLDELSEYENRIRDLFGRIPKEVQQLFKQRRLDLFVNLDCVESMNENKTHIVITMTEAWSGQVDGIRLFQRINQISKSIDLRLKNKKIEISIAKKNKYMPKVFEVIDLLQNCESIMKKR